jgi:hypothetical protein
MNHTEYASSLRLIADWFEAHPEVRLPHDADQFDYFMAHDRKQIAVLVRAFDGKSEKGLLPNSGLVEFSHYFGSIKFRVIANQNQVCNRIVLDKKVVPEVVIPAHTVPEHEEDIVEWDCSGSLLANQN